jgi:uncharacterized membrane protein HdeD (DUF308 family)
MILQLFIFAIFFLTFGIYNFTRRKKILGWFFVLLGVFALVIGWIVVRLYPHTMPFFR